MVTKTTPEETKNEDVAVEDEIKDEADKATLEAKEQEAKEKAIAADAEALDKLEETLHLDPMLEGIAYGQERYNIVVNLSRLRLAKLSTMATLAIYKKSGESKKVASYQESLDDIEDKRKHSLRSIAQVDKLCPEAENFMDIYMKQLAEENRKKKNLIEAAQEE